MPAALYNKYRDGVGMSHRQLKLLVAIMSYWNVYGEPVVRLRLCEFFDDVSLETALLERGRWIERTCSNPLTYRPTKRAWRELGEQERQVA